MRHVLQEELARALNWSVAHYSLACQLIGANGFVRLVFHKLISCEPPPHTRPQLPPPPLFFFLRGAWRRVTRLTDSSTLAEIRNRAIRVVFSRTDCPHTRGRWTDPTRPRAQCRGTQTAMGTQRCRRCPLAIDASTFCHCVSLHWILWRLDWFFCTEIPVMALAKRMTPYHWAQQQKKTIDTCDDTCVVKKRKTELKSDIAHLSVAEMQIHASKREREVTEDRL